MSPAKLLAPSPLRKMQFAPYRRSEFLAMLERTTETISASWRNDQLHTIHRDFETRGVLDLRRVGAHRYAADPRTEILCCAFAVDDQPVQLWVPGDPVSFPKIISAHSDGAVRKELAW
jgi:hypothetical protein